MKYFDCEGAKKYAEEDAEGKEHKIDLKLEAMIPVMRGEISLKAHAHQSDDILTAIRIAKEFNVKMTIDHCTDGARVLDELKESGFPVMFGPTLGRKGKYELSNKSFDTAKKLHDAGIEFCIITDSPVIPICYLGLCAGLAYKLLEKVNRYLAVIVSAIVCPVVNTGIFLLGSLVFFADIVSGGAQAEGISIGMYLIVFFVGLNFIFELIANIVISPGIVRILDVAKKKIRR